MSVALAQTKYPITYTGNAEKDFVERLGKNSNFATRAFPVVVSRDDDGGATNADVGVPPGFPFQLSGWDMKDLRFGYVSFLL